MLGGEPVDQRHIVIALVVGAFGHLLLHTVKHFFLLDVSGEGLPRLFDHGSVVGELHHLWQIADLRVVRDRDGACGWLLKSAEYFEHGRFAGTVLTHEGNAVAIVHGKTDMVKQGFDAELHF